MLVFRKIFLTYSLDDPPQNPIKFFVLFIIQKVEDKYETPHSEVGQVELARV